MYYSTGPAASPGTSKEIQSFATYFNPSLYLINPQPFIQLSFTYSTSSKYSNVSIGLFPLISGNFLTLTPYSAITHPFLLYNYFSFAYTLRLKNKRLIVKTISPKLNFFIIIISFLHIFPNSLTMLQECQTYHVSKHMNIYN